MFKIGDKVKSTSSYTNPLGQKGQITNITINQLGTTLYWLDVGGVFSAKELEAI